MYNFFKKLIFSKPVFRKCLSLCEYEDKKVIDKHRLFIEKKIIEGQKETRIKAFCSYCERQTVMAIDFLYAAKSNDGKLVPNFRERVVCENCGLNNRLRATYHFLKNHVNLHEKDIYITEEVTPFFNLLRSKTKSLIGSEYFPQREMGRIFIPQIGKEINNEDLTKLSFKNDLFDVVISLEVLEHVPDYRKALKEIFRVLKTGGSFIFSVPFIASSQNNIIRAKISGGAIEHLLPAEYHGDPVDNAGCLCFYHFGWEILDDLRKAGFSNVGVYSYSSAKFGYLGDGIILYANKFTGLDDGYQKKVQQELAIYEKRLKVHDLPEIYHYWSNKYLTPIFLDAGFKTIAEFFSSGFLEAKNRTGSKFSNFVSVGAGNCDFEVSMAKNLVDTGFKDFIFECLEINPVMLERGKEIARENGVLDNMRFVEADFNTWTANKKYDGVMANQALHHVTNLEHLFDQISKSLNADGSFVISDMIGRNGHQRWPESLGIVNRYWKELPESHRYNVLLKRLETEYENWDCSTEGFEGIRAQDVLPLLLERFKCEKFIGFGNAIDIFIDRCFGPNFDPKSERDKEFIDRVHAEDEAAIVGGKLTPTHMLAVFVKKMHVPAYYSRGVSPRSSVRTDNKSIGRFDSKSVKT
jgi:SAM-dependent methyltransferase